MAATVSYNCPLCSLAFPALKLYVSHLRVTHSKENRSTFSVMCGVNSCREVFRTFSAFNSHIYRHHRTEMGVNAFSEGDITQDQADSVSMSQACYSGHAEDAAGIHQDDMIYEFPSTSNSLMPRCQGTSTASFDRSLTAAKMLLQLREGHQVSQVALLDVISCCRFLCKQALSMFKADVITALGNSFEVAIAHIDLESYDQFKSIDTNYLFEKYCIDNLGCLVSRSACMHVVYIDLIIS